MAEEGVLAPVFDSFGKDVQDAVTALGFETPTEPQRLAIPSIAAGRHVLVIAPTGTGKTETAMLPVFDALVGRDEIEGIGALYITPLRALNRDMRDRLEWWGETLDLEIGVRHGDTSRYDRRRQAEDPPDILVTTPETLQAMLTGSKLRRALESISHVVVDEVHELASSKRGAQLSVGLERLERVAGAYQRIGLSATIGDPDRVANFLTGGRSYEIRTVDVGSRLEIAVETPASGAGDDNLAGELVTDTGTARHVRRITELVEENTATLIFVNTRQTAEALGSRFKAMGANVGVHHGSLATATRIDVEDAFKTGELDGLLCTSSMELGIDVGTIDHVVQYQSPHEVTRLLQRIGRAGHRADQRSIGTVIATHADDVLESLAIVEAALDGHVEPAAIHHGSLDTLANQVAGIVMDEGEISGAEIYKIITSAVPFADIEPETVRSVIEELARNYVVWLDEDEDLVSKTGTTWRYFYANLSMIPDEANFAVVDMASGSRIGTLDERFVVNFAEPGEIFVQRGEMWRIIEIDEDRERVNVSPIEDPSGEIPSWTGQEIPVPFAVAQTVGRYRDRLVRALETDSDPDAQLPPALRGSATLETALDPIRRHVDGGIPMPTHDRIVVEAGEGTAVINACFGHQTNETIGRVLASLLGHRTGSSIGLDVDPYRIELDVPHSVTAETIVELLETTDPDHVRGLIELSLKRSEALSFRLAQVATKFGAIKNWDSDTPSSPPRRLVAALADTPMYEEAVRELIHEELALETAARMLGDIQAGDRTIVTHSSRTPIGLEGRTGMADLFSPKHADASVIATVKDRLMNDRIILACVHCGEWTRRTTVGRTPDQPRCPRCESTRIAALNPWDQETVEAVQSADKTEDQHEMTVRANRAASLVQSHGKQAVIALAARGVGPHNAARIIAKLREDEDEFFRDLLAQERQYARTRSFWD